MASPQIQDKSEGDSPHWPASAMLLYGTFGTRTLAGRRYHIRSGIALAVIAGWILLAGAVLRATGASRSAHVLTALVPGIAFAYIAWEFRRYLRALDELARRIQLESIAWTYLTGIALAVLFGGVVLVTGWRLNPILFIVVLEPVRAGWLYFVSRRY